MRAPGGKKSVWAGSRARRWIGPHCNGSWACRAAIRFAHRGARLIDDADPEHDAVITPSEAVKALSLINFPAQKLVLFAPRVVFGSDLGGFSGATMDGPHCNGSWARRAAIRFAHRRARLIDDADPEHDA
jgi:hypothetical protein